MRRMSQIAIVPVLATVIVAQLMPGTSSSFTDTTGTQGNTVSAAADWTGPSLDDVVVQKAEGGATGKIRPGGRFYVYANAIDSGSPAAGVQSVTAAVSSVATTSSATLVAGSWSVAGTAYGYRSAQLTAKSWVSAGAHQLTISAVDAAGNPPTSAPVALEVAGGAFAGADVTTTDRRGNTGLAQTDDELAFVYDRAPEPDSLVAGWDGTPTTVKVLLVDGALYGMSGSTDLIAPVSASGDLLGLGYVVLNGDYVYKNSTVTFSGSELTLDGATVTVTLGSQSGSARDDNTAVSQTGSSRRQF
jgi:hypothetical protein